MKIVIPGGSGQLGTLVARTFRGDGHDVVVIARTQQQRPWRTIAWDGCSLGPWAAEFDGADVVINLAGRSVNCRYTAENRAEIMRSRIQSTAVVGEAIAAARRPPPLWLQASTATIYAHTFTTPNDETTGTIGGTELNTPASWRFSIDVATAWERTLDEARTPATRKVAMRSAMVMTPDAGGIFDTLKRLARFGLGGSAAGGHQYVSWIHGEDFTRSLYWIMRHEALDGPINLAAPEPIPYSAFMAALRHAVGARVALPATRWMVEIGAFALRTESELVLKSRRVVPGRLLESGFAFHFPCWPDAVSDLCANRASDPRPTTGSTPK